MTFDQMAPKALAAGVVGLVVLAVWLTSSAPQTRNDKVLVKPTGAFDWVRHKDEIDASVSVVHRSSGSRLDLDLYAGSFYELPAERDSEVWEVRVRRYHYLVDPGWDLGVYAGFRSSRSEKSESPVDVGVRFSPCRFLFDYLSADGLASGRDVGVGLSLYPPREHFGDFWHHTGVGLGSAWDWRDGYHSNLFYVAFSTRF